MISTDSPIPLHGDAPQLTSPTGSRPKILVTRRQFQDQVDRLNEVSDALVLDRPAPATPDELQVAATGAHGIFAHITDAIDVAAMDAAGSNLKVIAEFGVGYDNIDVDAASERNIVVANTPGVLTEAAADFRQCALAIDRGGHRRRTLGQSFVQLGSVTRHPRGDHGHRRDYSGSLIVSSKPGAAAWG